MDRMHNNFFKTLFAGIFGSGTSWGAWLLSEQCGVLLARCIQAVGLIAGVTSIIYMIKINRHRDHRQVIEERLAENRLCYACLKTGKEPEGNCPVEHPPMNCPKELRKAKKVIETGFFNRLKKLGDGETTTK